MYCDLIKAVNKEFVPKNPGSRFLFEHQKNV